MLDELVTAAVSGRGLFLGSARALLRRDEANQPPRAEHAASPSESQRALVPYLLIALTSAVGALWLSYFFLLGSTYVLLSWVLEAASFCHLAPGAHWRVRVDIAAKPHLGALLPYAGIHPALNAPHAPSGPPLDSARILEPRGLLLAPWNLTMMAGVVVGARHLLPRSGPGR